MDKKTQGFDDQLSEIFQMLSELKDGKDAAKISLQIADMAKDQQTTLRHLQDRKNEISALSSETKAEFKEIKEKIYKYISDEVEKLEKKNEKTNDKLNNMIFVLTCGTFGFIGSIFLIWAQNK